MEQNVKKKILVWEQPHKLIFGWLTTVKVASKVYDGLIQQKGSRHTVVVFGVPGCGKTTLLNQLSLWGYKCADDDMLRALFIHRILESPDDMKLWEGAEGSLPDDWEAQYHKFALALVGKIDFMTCFAWNIDEWNELEPPVGFTSGLRALFLFPSHVSYKIVKNYRDFDPSIERNHKPPPTYSRYEFMVNQSLLFAAMCDAFWKGTDRRIFPGKSILLLDHQYSTQDWRLVKRWYKSCYE